ncbi:MAG: non-hydrolyzing UDP-N-acetylglucosamine 2-epimerase [Gaiellaceae bacterium]
MKIVHVVGARPNFMKVAPTMGALSDEHGVEQRLVHTGQHYDRTLSEAFFEDLDMPYPDAFLGVGSGSHAQQTALVMTRLESLIVEEAPDAVLVAGDTNSTMAAALCAAKLNTPVVHLEAGLRSGDRTMPEEVNRIVADHVAEVLLTPSRDADANLLGEGISGDSIAFVGNTMIDSLRRYEEQARDLEVGRRDYGCEGYVLVTLHRPALVDDANCLVEVMDHLEDVAAERAVLFPLHPRTRSVLRAAGWRPSRVRLLEPQSYIRFLSLQIGAFAVLTDSGGVQEETTVLGIPCFTLRTTTERPVTVTEGTNRVLGLGTEALETFREALEGGLPRRAVVPERWDGRAAQRVAEVVVGHYARALSALEAAR